MVHFFPGTKKNQLIFLALFFAIIVLLLRQPETQPPPSTKSASEESAEYYMKGFEIISSQADGKAQIWIKGDTLSQYPGNVAILISPEANVQNAAGERWNSRANSGLITNGNEITLDGGVQIKQLNRMINVETEQLTISLDEQTAHTDEAVSLYAPQSEIHAKGLLLEFEKNQLKLLSDVTATYESP